MNTPFIQSVRWGDVPTWIAALATVVAFAAAGWAAIAAWKVLAVERRRDRAQQAREERAHAERVAAWPSLVTVDPNDASSAEVWGVTMRNAGDMPIYQVRVERVPTVSGGGESHVIFEVVPPGEWLVNRGVMYPRPRTSSAARSHVGPTPPRPYVIEMTFTDVTERTWHRDGRGRLTLQQT